MADITSENNLNTRRERSYPRVVKRARPGFPSNRGDFGCGDHG